MDTINRIISEKFLYIQFNFVKISPIYLGMTKVFPTTRFWRIKETHNLDIKVSDMTFMYDIVLKSSFGIFMALSHLRHE